MTDTTARALADLVTLTPGGRAVPGHLTTPDLPGNLPVAVVDADRTGAITLIRPEADLWPTAAVIPAPHLDWLGYDIGAAAHWGHRAAEDATLALLAAVESGPVVVTVSAAGKTPVSAAVVTAADAARLPAGLLSATGAAPRTDDIRNMVIGKVSGGLVQQGDRGPITR